MKKARIGILAECQCKDAKKALESAIKRHGFPAKAAYVLASGGFSKFDALVLPRGSSMHYSMLVSGKLGARLRKFARRKPVLAICGALIVCASELGRGCEGREKLCLLRATVDNNCLDGNSSVLLRGGKRALGSFTDAPVLRRLGRKVAVLARAKGRIVGAQDGNVFGFSYFDATGDSYLPFLEAAVSLSARARAAWQC